MDMKNPKQPALGAVPQPEKQILDHAEKIDWETPTMEDVSEQVMAQPYIRFT